MDRREEDSTQVTIQTINLAGKRFVIVPEKDFERLQRQAEDSAELDRGDIAEAKKRKAAGPARPYSQLRKKLGLA